jgi:indole-3-glycerol phosphate synthase
MLAEILADTRRQLSRVNTQVEIARIEGQMAGLPPVRSLRSSLLSEPTVSLIAEIKRRSPSKGLLVENLDVAITAQDYERAGARAISVVTEEKHFDGSVADVPVARRYSTLPVLRKDFIVHEYQLYHSRLIGADAVLLIVAALSRLTFVYLLHLARDIGLEVVSEVHNERELEVASHGAADIIGINNRDLTTFAVDLSVTERLRPLIVNGAVTVAESGIHSREDVLRMQDSGVDGMLIGECLMTSDNRERKIGELLGKDHDAC